MTYKDVRDDSINKYRENFNSYLGAGLFLLIGIVIFSFFVLLTNYLTKIDVAYSTMYILVILSFIFVLYPMINMSFLKIGIINENNDNNTNVVVKFTSFYLFCFRHPSKGALRILFNVLLCLVVYLLIGSTLVDYIVFSIYQSVNPEVVDYINAYYNAIANADFYTISECLIHLQIPIMISDITCGIIIISFLVHKTSLNFLAFGLKLNVFPKNLPAPNKVVYLYTKEIKAMSNGEWRRLYYGSNWPIIVSFYFTFILCNILLALFNPNKDGIFILFVSLLIASVVSIVFIPYFYSNIYDIDNYLIQKYLNTLLLNNLNKIFDSPDNFNIPPDLKNALQDSKNYIEDLVKKQKENKDSNNDDNSNNNKDNKNTIDNSNNEDKTTSNLENKDNSSINKEDDKSDIDKDK